MRIEKGASLLLILTLAIVYTGIAQTVDTTDYFPLVVGNRYTYYQSLPCPPDTVRSRYGPWGGNLVRDTTFINGRKYFITVVAGLELGSDTVRVDSSGNMVIRGRGIEQTFYKFHAAVGDTWSYQIEVGGREYRYIATMKSRADTVRVHAGTFPNCLRIGFDVPGSIDDEFDDWLAPNFGLVFRCRWEPLEVYEAIVNGIHYPIISSVQEDRNPITSFSLLQNYPNPFNPSTMIQYTIGRLMTGPPVSVRLVIHNILGQEVKTLVEGVRQPGTYRVTWDGTNNSGKRAPSGVYIYRLMAGNYVSAKTMVLMR
jgi:hypothetical protein